MKLALLCKNYLLKNLDHVQPKLDLAWVTVGAVSLSHDAVVMLSGEEILTIARKSLGESFLLSSQ